MWPIGPIVVIIKANVALKMLIVLVGNTPNDHLIPVFR